MKKFINAFKNTDPLILVSLVLMFTVAFMLGQHTTAKDIKKHYIVDASEIEVVYHNPYKALTLDTCQTDYECNIAHLLYNQENERFVSTDDPIFFPDSVSVLEPIDCEQGDTECEKANELNAGKPAYYPSICEPYIFDTKL